jgi:amino acid adenylation domain-containing protein
MTIDEGSRVSGTGHSAIAYGEGGVSLRAAPRPAAPGSGRPLSWFQERLWIHHERAPQDTSYNLPLTLLVKGDLDVLALEHSLNAISARHESLRTYFGQTDDGDPVQFVTPPEPIRLPAIAVDHAQMLEHLERHLEHRFDLARGPVFIASLLRLSEGKHLLLLNVHHIAADAWSLRGVLLSELQMAYAAFASGQRPLLPPLSVQYGDYASRQRAEDMSAHLDYWRELLAGYEDNLEVPTECTRQARSGTKSARFTYRYPNEFALELERFSRRHGCTIFMSLLAGLAVTLSRHASKDDLCIGTTTSNRTSVDVEPLIGFFINILPLRLHIDEESSVEALLKAVRARVLAAFDHQSVPFEHILQASGVARRGSANPLVPVVMRHQNFPYSSLRAPLPGDVRFGPYPDPAERDDAAARLLGRDHVPARCEIELSYAGGGNELEVEVVYASDLHDRGALERLLAQHQSVLSGMFTDASRRVRDLPLLRESDVQRLLEQYNRSPSTAAPGWTFVERFDARVKLNSSAVACWDERGSWSYLELAQRANQVAHALAARGVRPGDLVGVCLDRSGTLLATLLGVWKAGAGYVPLDPAYPTAYLRQILGDARPVVIVCGARHQARLELDDAVCLRLDGGSDVANYPDTPPHLHAGPEALAYVMYTSGSTGKPKGVRVPHRQLCNWLSGIEANLPFEEGEVVGQKTTFVFAVAVKELFAGLLNGCPQAFVSDETVRDTGAFVAALAKYRVSRLNIGPSHLASVLEHLHSSGQRLPALKVCVTAGEPLPKDCVLAFRALLPSARLINNYGCTELNDITYYDTANFDGQRDFVPIGTPIQNTKVYVLDRHGRLVPEGVAGELHVASASLPEGYHGLDALTAERFLPNPFGDQPSDRLYNTGDVVRYLSDGTLDFIGRWDFQVKVRGFRVDVRHVEKVLGDFDGIRARAVVGKGDRLVAFYTTEPGKAVRLEELRGFLQERLPAYMVPETFVLLEAMPQLPNGKLNRRALLESDGELQQSGAYEPPSSATQRALAAVWADVVGVPGERIGRHTSFFDIGGHSLSAMRVSARIKDLFRVELRFSQLFDAPTLEALAAAVDDELTRRPLAKSAGQETARPAPRAAPQSGLLSDKVALVTGGSRGIGLATALLLAEHGAKVAINYRESERQAYQGKQLIEARGGTAEVFRADVTRAREVAELVQAVRARFGRIDVLVANASISFRKRPFVEYDWEDLEQKVTDELKAVFYPCQAVVNEMLERRQGSIVAISSGLSRHANQGFVAQSTAKAALDAFVRALAAELGPGGVRVNTVAPGVTLTDAASPMSLGAKAASASQCPLGRNGLPEDMAGAVLFLASDLSRFMTGSYLPVDGGFTML